LFLFPMATWNGTLIVKIISGSGFWRDKAWWFIPPRPFCEFTITDSKHKHIYTHSTRAIQGKQVEWNVSFSVMIDNLAEPLQLSIFVKDRLEGEDNTPDIGFYVGDLKRSDCTGSITFQLQSRARTLNAGQVVISLLSEDIPVIDTPVLWQISHNHGVWETICKSTTNRIEAYYQARPTSMLIEQGLNIPVPCELQFTKFMLVHPKDQQLNRNLRRLEPIEGRPGQYTITQGEQRDIESIKIDKHQVQWEWINNDTWVPYDDDKQETIETAFQRGEVKVVIKIDVTDYVIDFRQYQQVNTITRWMTNNPFKKPT